MMPLSQLDPGIMDYIDTDGISKHLIKVLGIPATAIKGDQEVAQQRQQRAQAQQAQAQQAQLTEQAQAAGSLAPLIEATKQ